VAAAAVISASAAPTVAGQLWVTHPQAAAADAANQAIALQFRKDLTLPAKPKRFVVQVSADDRYVLTVNGRRVAAGPSRGDLAHWRYQTLDLAPYLKKGVNVLAAQVWSDGKVAPLAQISAGKTAFTLWAADPAQNQVDTDAGWRVRVDGSRVVQAGMPQLLREVGPTYYAAAGPETHIGESRAWDWASPSTMATDWSPVVPALAAGSPSPWTLTADQIPQMSYATISAGRVVRSQGATDALPDGPTTVSAGSEAVFLVDAGRVLAAYPELVISGGRGAEVTVKYTEALYGPDRQRLKDRASIEGKVLGLTDTFRPDGGAGRSFHPFWWRTWRFAEIRVKTAGEPLRLEAFKAHETGYPFEQRGRFESNDPQLNEIWRVGWRTALLDAHETYMDTAYWEQLQYIGDTRLQALISFAVSGDGRLAAQAIDAFEESRKIEGLPQSAAPSSSKNLIPPFAPLWIGMVHDYWTWQPDAAVVRRSLPGVRAVLEWHSGYLGDNGLLRPTPGWMFVDWRPTLDGRSKGKASEPGACVTTLLYLGALQQAADLEAALGEPARAEADRAQAARLATAVQRQCWDAGRGIFADDAAKTRFSQHVNSLAVLYDVAPKAEQAAILQRVVAGPDGIEAPEGVTGTTYYFSYYLLSAMEKAGLGDRYAGQLGTWRKLLAQNFTTWPENPDPTRSDTHAWSAHPTSDLLTVVAGIRPAAPGFAQVKVEPHLGELNRLQAAMPHPLGTIEARYRRNGDTLVAEVRLPKGLPGRFVWRGESRPLKAGRNSFRLPWPQAERASSSSK
jgi:hypothetical protein